jgi:hypothetical protein
MIVWLPMSTRIDKIINQTGEPLTWLGPTMAILSLLFTLIFFIVGYIATTRVIEKKYAQVQV